MQQRRAGRPDGDTVRRRCDLNDAACRSRVARGHANGDTQPHTRRHPNTSTNVDAYSQTHSDADNRADPGAHGHTHSNSDADTATSTDANPDTRAPIDAPAHTAL